jgi:glutaredoxin
MTIASAVVVYTHPDCSYSYALMEELDAGGVLYTEIDVTKHPEKIDDVLKLTKGERITPVMVEGDVVTIGFRGVG